MFIIEYFYPYNNFIIIFCIILLNTFLMFKRSYWQTFLIGNLLLLAFLVIIGFDPVKTFLDIIKLMIDFISDVFKQFGNFLEEIFKDIKDSILDWILPWR